MLIGIFVFCIVIIIIALMLRLLGVGALITSSSDKKTLEAMDQKINAFENEVFSTPEEKEKAKRQLKRELIELKKKILYVERKKETEDKISLV